MLPDATSQGIRSHEEPPPSSERSEDLDERALGQDEKDEVHENQGGGRKSCSLHPESAGLRPRRL